MFLFATYPLPSRSKCAGLRCAIVPLGFVFCACILCRGSDAGTETTKIRTVIYLWFDHIHGKFWHLVRADGTLEEYVPGRSNVLHNNLCRINDHDVILDLYEGWAERIRTCLGGFRFTVGGFVMVPSIIPSRWDDGVKYRHEGDVHYAATSFYCLLQVADHVHASLFQILHEIIVTNLLNK